MSKLNSAVFLMAHLAGDRTVEYFLCEVLASNIPGIIKRSTVIERRPGLQCRKLVLEWFG
jgi:hypothetical protein